MRKLFWWIGASTVGAAVGTLFTFRSMRTMSQAKEIVHNAKNIFDKKKAELECQRGLTVKELSKYGELKIQIWDEQFSRFIKLFGVIKNAKSEGNVNVDSEIINKLTPEKLSEMKQLYLTAGEIAIGGIALLGTGALSGVALYGGAMMFASASTGTTIASISGIAATNATLAWFGGGAVAAGGLGMAGGAVILGGLVAGPMLAVGGVYLNFKANTNLKEARAKHKETEVEVEKMKSAISMLDNICLLTNQYYCVLKKLNALLTKSLDELDRMLIDFSIGKSTTIKYNELNEEEKKILHAPSLAIQLIKIVLEKPLLNEENVICNESKEYIEETDFGILKNGVLDVSFF